MKAIATQYAGYLFRSRLEARWSVFFETLHIPYRYESEGYELDGIRYLPDFWLPEQDCWLEIKGQSPTEVEQEKARRLALQGGKEVYLLAGECWFPPAYQGYRYAPPRIFTFPQGKAFGKESKVVPLRPEVGMVLQQLLDQGITLSVKYGYVTLHLMQSTSVPAFATQEALVMLERCSATLAGLAPLVYEHRHELLEVLTPEPGWQREYYGQTMSPGFAWAECSACGTIALCARRDVVDDEEACRHAGCTASGARIYRTDSPRLRAAYQAARQERFSTERVSR